MYEPVFKKFLFSWDISENSFCLPENDKKRLRSCLLEDLGLDWAENAEICKHDDEKTIRIAKNENAAEIKIDEQKEKATLKIRGVPHDLNVKKKDGKLNIYYVKFPHSQVWRVLVTLAYVCISIPFLCVMFQMNSSISEKEGLIARLAICSLWVLILYLSSILWFPVHNIWECIERIDYAKICEEKLREKIRSTLVAFSIAFIVLGVSIITATFPQNDLNVVKLMVIGLLIAGVIFLIVTFEIYDSCLNPAFNSAQIKRLYTKGWWLYTIGIYSIVLALLLYVYPLEPLITIVGVIIFIFAFSYYLLTPCVIDENWRIDK